LELIIGITGASGVIYGIRLLEHLSTVPECKTHLIVSESAKELIAYETKMTLPAVRALADHYHENTELSADIASGSKRTDGMVIVPCSMSTAAKINCGISDNLITRTADVCFKEQRKLIIVPRETPCNTTHLKNLYELSSKGALVLPAMPGFYTRPTSLEDTINFIIGKILDNLNLAHDLFPRWTGEVKE
jgi:4-hydroxy-3-polyprenylbenzoate decarboxylase